MPDRPRLPDPAVPPAAPDKGHDSPAAGGNDSPAVDGNGSSAIDGTGSSTAGGNGSPAIDGNGNSAADDHDSPWKEALELYFSQAMALLAPALHTAVDWSVAPLFMDKELQPFLVPDGPRGQGRRHVDKLVRVRLRDGVPAWILVHIEVQGGAMGPRDRARFARRMFQYRYLILDSIARMTRSNSHGAAQDHAVALYSLGILIHSRSGLTQLQYRDTFLGQGVQFTFPVVELSQWLGRWEVLEQLAFTNPFAVFIMAQLQATRHRDKATRLGPLLDLVRKLYGYGYAREQIGQLLRLVEWVLRLPPALEPDYLLAVEQLDQEHKMSYVTIAERMGIQKGRAEGIQAGRIEGIQEGRIEGIQAGRAEGQSTLLLRLIERRFGSVPPEIEQTIRTAGVDQLEHWSLAFVDAATLEDIFRD